MGSEACTDAAGSGSETGVAHAATATQTGTTRIFLMAKPPPNMLNEVFLAETINLQENLNQGNKGYRTHMRFS